MDKSIEKMRSISEEIIKTDLLTERQCASIMNKFYTIMRKYGIAEGTALEDGIGRSLCNYEWTMCKNLFIDVIKTQLESYTLFRDRTPEDLKVYPVNNGEES